MFAEYPYDSVCSPELLIADIEVMTEDELRAFAHRAQQELCSLSSRDIEDHSLEVAAARIELAAETSSRPERMPAPRRRILTGDRP